jgi:class 3 adenylate cyclase
LKEIATPDLDQIKQEEQGTGAVVVLVDRAVPCEPLPRLCRSQPRREPALDLIWGHDAETIRRRSRPAGSFRREGRLGIRQVTFLFTDLNGSTAMYGRLGDLNANALVREHFALLDSAAHEHSGAIVKKIGAALMAVFPSPMDGVAAALHILEEIGRFNHEHGEPDIILKIGAHFGPSIAVTLNDNLDYFGQTVNVAARVQSLADAGEICITEALHAAPGVSDLLAGHSVAEFDAPLRGVEGNARVYRIVYG